MLHRAQQPNLVIPSPSEVFLFLSALISSLVVILPANMQSVMQSHSHATLRTQVRWQSQACTRCILVQLV